MHLFIDTHLNKVAILLYENHKIIKSEIIDDKIDHSRILMPTIKRVLNNQVPESILVVNGPGSFTSVRLGVTIAKSLAYTLDLPIRVISSLECLAISTDEEEKIVAFSDNNGYYIGIFNNDLELIGEYVYLSNKEFLEYNKQHKVITDIELDYLKIIEHGLNKKIINPHKVNPIYIKKLDVEK